MPPPPAARSDGGPTAFINGLGVMSRHTSLTSGVQKLLNSPKRPLSLQVLLMPCQRHQVRQGAALRHAQVTEADGVLAVQLLERLAFMSRRASR